MQQGTLKPYKFLFKEMANIGEFKGMRVKVYSGHGIPNLHVILPGVFEVEFANVAVALV